MATIQANREISVACALGADVLLLRRMRGSESLSALSEYELELYSERADLKIDDLLATPIGVTVDLPRVPVMPTSVAPVCRANLANSAVDM